MLKYVHAINDLGSGRKIQYVDGSRSLVGAYRENQGAGSTDYQQPVYLADRREVFKNLLENGAKTGAEAEEKKCLINIRNTYKILFLTKGIVL